MQAVWNGVVIAEGSDTIDLDGTKYFLPDAIKTEYFEKSQTTSVCGWKGMASYYTVTVNGKTNRDCAWCYADPNDAAKKIKGRIAFWNGVRIED